MPMPKKAPSMPKPFKRPSVSISIETVNKTWQHVTADHLRLGDTVADLGTIHAISIDEELRGWTTTIRNGNGDRLTIREGDTVFAFTATIPGG